VRFQILGPLQVLDGDADVPLGSPKERAVLGMLLLHAGAVVSRERLIDGLWGESPPLTAAKALNVHVSQLRKTLARDGQEPIATRPPGYVIDLDAETLDAMRFEQLAADARAHVASGDVASASRLLRDALSLWRGPALDGVELESQARNEAARLDELRLGAQMDRIDCELALGLHEHLIPELEALVEEHPLRERLRGQLILALYRAGRQADALRCYRDTRETLVGELAIEPSPALQRLEKAVLTQDRSLEIPSGISTADARRLQEPRRARPGRRVRWLMLAAAFAIAGIAAGVALTTSSSAVQVLPNSVGVIDPHHNRVVAAVPVGRRPGPVVYADGSVWVANLRDTTLTRIDARRRHVVGTTPLGGSYPTALAAADGIVWSGDPVQATIKRVAGSGVTAIPIVNCHVAPGSCKESLSIPCATHISLAIGGPTLWATCGANFGRTTLTALDLATARQSTATYAEATNATALAYADDALWVANYDTNSVSELNPVDRTVESSVTVPAGPVAMVAFAGSVWVASSTQPVIARIQITAGTGAPNVTTVDVGGEPVAIAGGDGAVWVADSGSREILRIDPQRVRVTARIHVGGSPAGVAVGDGMVWVSSQTPT
jgi:DNA-binding SARP family transcriptional activator/streptogramin lyase